MTATCINPECDRQGVEEPQEVTLAEGEPVFCGGCFHPYNLED